MNPRVAKGLAFNCPDCGVGIGDLCVNVRGSPMGHFVHHERIPWENMGEFREWQVRTWLERNWRILTDDKPE